ASSLANSGSCLAFSYSAASSWISGIRVSATYWPPNEPNRPRASGPLRYEVMGDLLEYFVGASLLAKPNDRATVSQAWPAPTRWVHPNRMRRGKKAIRLRRYVRKTHL